MTFAPGTRLGAYEITGPLGEGGMGVVYRARDTKLNRDVAIKVLPDLFAADRDRLARFEREAQTLAALNHPHIAQIYGLVELPPEGGSHTVSHALVMEFVDGDDLAQRIARGAIPVDEALPIARQIAEALEAAHARGIVHRDLKPANIKLTRDGTVKVLDFGLAKAMSGDTSVSLENSPTFTSPAMTELGVILGTAAYMAPEQAKGRAVDKRADIWAFGCVLYEMLTGRRPFEGEDVTDTIAAIMRSEPDWTRLPRDLSPAVESYLRRCVQKNPSERVQDAGDLRLALSGAFDVPVSSQLPSQDRPRRSSLTVVAAAVALAVMAGAVTWQLKPEPASVPASVRRFTITPGPSPLAIANTNRDIAITPDGSALIYLSGQGAAREICVRRLDALAGTALRPAPRYYEPTVSPDSQWVAFNDEADYTLRKMSIAGGPIIAIAAVGREMLGAAWGADDSIVFATDHGLWRVAAAGGTPVSLARPDQSRGELTYAWPEFLPNGNLLFTVRSGARRGDVIAALDLKSGVSKVVVRGATNPRYSRTGHLLYVADGIVRAVAFNPEALEVRGEAVAVVDGVGAKGSGAADFTISADGTLVYVNGGPAVAQRRLAWIGRDGTRQPLNAPPRSYAVARISPDGTRVALDVREQETDIWIWDLTREILTRFTTDPGFDGLAAWLPDSRRLVWASSRQGTLSPFLQSADGTGEAQRLFNWTLADNPTSITHDGKWLIFRRDASNTAQQGASDIMMALLNGREKPTPLLAGSATELNGEVSPDGRWLAYDSDESGLPEVYVRPFPQVQGGRWQISNRGGGHAAWDPNGRGVYYVSLDARLFFASWSATPAPSVGAPTLIETPAIYEAIAARSFDVAPDGKRLLVIEPINSGPLEAPSLTVVLNWAEDLKRRADSGSPAPR